MGPLVDTLLLLSPFLAGLLLLLLLLCLRTAHHLLFLSWGWRHFLVLTISGWHRCTSHGGGLSCLSRALVGLGASPFPGARKLPARHRYPKKSAHATEKTT
jgi:hypothetical protein